MNHGLVLGVLLLLGACYDIDEGRIRSKTFGNLRTGQVWGFLNSSPVTLYSENAEPRRLEPIPPERDLVFLRIAAPPRGRNGSRIVAAEVVTFKRGRVTSVQARGWVRPSGMGKGLLYVE